MLLILVQVQEFDLHLYDIQTFTILKCGAFSGSQVVTGARIRGLSSGAIGYAAKNAGSTGSNEIALSQTTGTFIKGEQIIINEKQTDQFISIKDILAFTIDDVKMVFQDADGLDASLPSDFSADTVLYDRVLPGFSPSDQINIVGTAATAVNRNFAGKVGIHTGSIIAYNGEGSVPSFNEITNISTDGKTLTLAATTSVTGVNLGVTAANSKTTSSPFRVKVPFVQNFEDSGIFAELPKQNVSTVNLSDSNLIISRQITNQAINSSSISFTSTQGFKCKCWNNKCIF